MGTSCWRCGTNAPDYAEGSVNYCVACGTRLLQECFNCGNSISCMLDECPSCDRIFSRCTECNIIYNLTDSECTHCGQKTSQNYVLFQPNGVNTGRNNCFIPKNAFEIESKKINFDGKVSPFVICNTNIIYWKKINNNCRLFCDNIKNNKNHWRDCPVEPIKIEDILFLEVSGAFVITYLSNKILINSLSDGSSVSAISVSNEYQAYMLNSNLYLIQKGTNIQQIDVYVYPFKTPELMSNISILDNGVSHGVLPVAGTEFIYFVDFMGNIARLNTNAKSYEKIYPSKPDIEFEYLALHETHLLITMKCAGGTRDVYKIDINSPNFEYFPIITNLNLATPKIAIFKDFLFLCESNNNNLRFSKYQIIPYSRGTDDHRNANTTHVADFYLAVIEHDIYIVYKCKSRSSMNAFEIRRMNFQTGDYGSKGLQLVNSMSQVCITNVYDKTVIAELNNGNVSIY